MRRTVVGLATLVAASGCASEYHPEYHPESSYSMSQTISYPTTVFVSGGPPVVSSAPGLARSARSDPSRVLVLQGSHLDRPAEALGVVDAHVPMGSHEAALDTLRRQAAQLGADAVVGVGFHHGEADAEPTHLSGLAVRFLQAVPYAVER